MEGGEERDLNSINGPYTLRHKEKKPQENTSQLSLAAYAYICYTPWPGRLSHKKETLIFVCLINLIHHINSIKDKKQSS